MSEFLLGASVQVQVSGLEQTPGLIVGYDQGTEMYTVRFEGGQAGNYQAHQLKNWCTCDI